MRSLSSKLFVAFLFGYLLCLGGANSILASVRQSNFTVGGWRNVAKENLKDFTAVWNQVLAVLPTKKYNLPIDLDPKQLQLTGIRTQVVAGLNFKFDCTYENKTFCISAFQSLQEERNITIQDVGSSCPP